MTVHTHPAPPVGAVLTLTTGSPDTATAAAAAAAAADRSAFEIPDPRYPAYTQRQVTVTTITLHQGAVTLQGEDTYGEFTDLTPYLSQQQVLQRIADYAPSEVRTALQDLTAATAHSTRNPAASLPEPGTGTGTGTITDLSAHRARHGGGRS